MGQGRYHFDWADVRRWVRLARQCGVRHMEFNHLFTQWGRRQRRFGCITGRGESERLLWSPKTPATGPVYRRFLAQYLPQLERFCRKRGHLRGRVLSPVRRAARGGAPGPTTPGPGRCLAELAPWMKTMDALSEIEFARRGLVDMPVPSISTTAQFVQAGIPSWTYFCCGPRGRFLQRLMDTPLAKIRAAGWLFYRTGVRGLPALGLQLLVQAAEPRADRPVHVERRRGVARMGTRRPVRRVSRRGWPDRLGPLGGLR